MGFAKLSLKARALKYLAAREHSRAELERKLATHAESAEQLSATLDELQARGYLSEARFVESVLHRRAQRWGARRIQMELQSQGVASDRVAEATRALATTEFERALALWQRKFGIVAEEAGARARQARFLTSRGFAPDVVWRVVRGSQDEMS